MLTEFVLGVLAGVLTGLLPGIHPNLVVAVFLYPDPWFVVPMAIVNSIVDTIPSILLGAPEPGNEMSVLPGHKLLMSGMGYDAIRRTIIGSLLGGLFSIIILPIAVVFSKGYASITPLIPILLLFITLFTVRDVFSAFLFVFSGLLGLMANNLNIHQPLVPLLTGMFGLSRLVTSLNVSNVPPQTTKVEYTPSAVQNRSAFFGTILGMFSGFLPGIGSSQSAYIASALGGDFLTALGSITTSNALFSLLSLELIGKVRSGVALALTGEENPFLIFSIALMAVAVGSIASLSIANVSVKLVSKVNYRLLSSVVIATLIGVVLWSSGILGLLVMVTSAALGIMAITKGARQSSLMGVIVIPTIVYFITKFML